MKDKILSIASDLRECFISTDEAVNLLKELLSVGNKKKFIVSYKHEDYGSRIMYAEINACSDVEAETIFFKTHDILSDVIEIKLHDNDARNDKKSF